MFDEQDDYLWYFVYGDGLGHLYLYLYLYLYLQVFICCVFVLLPIFRWIKIYIKQAINEKLQGSAATYFRCGGVVNNQTKKGLLLSLSVIFFQISDYLAKFLAVWWSGSQSAWDNHVLACNLAKYSPIYIRYDTIRYEMLFNVRSKADMSRLNLPHGDDN